MTALFGSQKVIRGRGFAKKVIGEAEVGIFLKPIDSSFLEESL